MLPLPSNYDAIDINLQTIFSFLNEYLRSLNYLEQMLLNNDFFYHRTRDGKAVNG